MENKIFNSVTPKIHKQAEQLSDAISVKTICYYNPRVS